MAVAVAFCILDSVFDRDTLRASEMKLPAQSPSLGVVLPTRNAMSFLVQHVESMQHWWNRAAEIVVVDSESSDGTVEFLRSELKHPKVQFLAHPPGLYASWNYGIQHLSSEFVYFSTVGDTITPAGIEELLCSAASLECDVVISPPEFVSPGRKTVRRREWPVFDIIDMLGLRAAKRLEPMEALLFALWGLPDALTGSCASCIFRTKALQERPFRTDVGMAADSLWCVEHVLDLLWGAMPDRVTTFALHPTFASVDDRRRHEHLQRLDRVLIHVVEQRKTDGLVSAADLALIGWGDLCLEMTGWMDCKDSYDKLRSARTPWVLRPSAWMARSGRDRARSRLRHHRDAALRALKEAKRRGANAHVPDGLPHD